MNKKLIFTGVALIIIGAVVMFVNLTGGDEVDISEYESVQAEDDACPLDIDALIEENPDVYGVLEIEETDIVYPVLQSEDDTLYLDHNWKKSKDKNGALFTESEYNSKDFNDSVTVIYGHHMRSGAMFGDLQEIFSDSESFERHRSFKIYTEDGTYSYRVFAALPYDNRHILYSYDFDNPIQKAAFFDTVFSVRDLGANIIKKDYYPEGGRVVILSTCLKGNNKNRYLVMGQEV